MARATNSFFNAIFKKRARMCSTNAISPLPRY